MVNDTVSDLISRIRNAYAAGNQQFTAPYSTLSESLAGVLIANGYLARASVSEAETKRGSKVKQLTVDLKYINGQPVLTGIKRMSKPGRRQHRPATKLPYVLGGLGMAIVSTSQGLLTDKEARQKRVGGELVCVVW